MNHMHFATHSRSGARKSWCGLSAVLFVCTVLSAAEPQMPPVPNAEKSGAEKTADLASNPAYLIDLAQVHCRYGAASQAEPLLRKVLELGKPEQKTQAVMLLSQIFSQKNDFAGAAQAVESVLAGLPEGLDRARVTQQLAMLYQQAKDAAAEEKTLLILSKLVFDAKDQAEGKWIVRNANQRLLDIWSRTPGRLDTLAKEAEAAVAANAKDEAALERLAAIYGMYLADPAKLAAVMEKLAVLQPESAETSYRLLDAYRRSKQYDKALDLCKKQMASSQSKPIARRAAGQAGQLLLESGRHDEAMAWMKENFSKADQSIEDAMVLASFYSGAKMPEASEETLAKALPLSRSPDERAQIMLRIAASALQRKDFAKADDLLSRLQNDFKDKRHIQDQVKALKARRQQDQASRPALPPAPVKPNAPPSPAVPPAK